MNQTKLQLPRKSMHIFETASISNVTVNSSCMPFFKKSNQAEYYADIDGQKYPRVIPLFLNKSINFECLNKESNKKKIILMWTKYFGKFLDYNFNLNQEPPELSRKDKPDTYFLGGYCPVHNCEVTYDKKLLKDADIVITHMAEKLNIEDLPKTRPFHQRWVFMIFESPMHSREFSSFNGFYNLSMTQRQESQFSGYSALANGMIWAENKNFNIDSNIFGQKSKMVTAVISNCHDKSGRLKYIKEMQKYIDVDVFGNCGKPCPVKFNNGTKGDCKDILSNDYKFYLSFENSLCTDYITEKFHDTLKSNIIPVVMGGGQYDLYVSFIQLFECFNYLIQLKYYC